MSELGMQTGEPDEDVVGAGTEVAGAGIEKTSPSDEVASDEGSPEADGEGATDAAAASAEIAGLSEEAQGLLKNLGAMLNEEKWTRATLGNYSTAQFKEFDTILKDARQFKAVDALKRTCDEHLSHSKNSIIALYLSGMVALSHQIIDDGAMVSLVGIFVDNHKWAIVKYLCGRILDYGESKFALRTQIECCKNDNDEEGINAFRERLVKADYEDADSAKLLAEHCEKLGKNDAAVEYYKKALHRYINKGIFVNVRDIWEKLLEFCPEELEFFLHVQKKVGKNISEGKAIDLLNLVYASRKEKNLNTAMNVLKLILQYDEQSQHARKEIVECYRRKYAGHSHLEDYIRISNLSQSFRNVHEAIATFEKHIAFDKGNYVFHRTWGVGKIAAIEGDEIRIDFVKKRDHAMSLRMAVEALQTLSNEHIWVQRVTCKKADLLERIKNDRVWALKTVIRSFGNSCDLKRIKAELCPSMLSEREWTSWSSKAREILKSDPSFGVSPDNIDVFTVREHPISICEKLYNEFKAERNFYHRVAIARSFAGQDHTEDDLEYLSEMLAYFGSFLKTANTSSEYSVAACLLLKELSGKYPSQIKEVSDSNPQFAAAVLVNFADIFKGIGSLYPMYAALKDGALRKELIRQIRNIYGWADIYVQLFPRTLDAGIVEELEKENEDKLTAMTADCFERYRERREAVIWLYRMYAEAKAKLNAVTETETEVSEATVRSRAKAADRVRWYEAAKVSFERQIVVLLHLLDITHRDIENQKDTVEARKLNRQVHTILFKDDTLGKFVDDSGPDVVTRIYSFISDLKNLDPQDRLNLRGRVQARFPDFKFTESSEKKAPQGLTVTKGRFEEKQKQLLRIMETEIPANSREIEDAKIHGDLKENAEYAAAKEKQTQLNTMAERLKEDIERAKIFDPAMIDTSRVSFGTLVVLKNEADGKIEEFTILGPWESDPGNNIISYQAPFGKAMINKVSGDRVQFTSDGKDASYLVERIKAASF